MSEQTGDVRELTMSEALNEALTEEMARDSSVFVVGEDIAAMGGLFQVTSGLLERFGSQRVIDAPISEAAQAGAAVGAALVGCRPVVELQIADFVSLVMDQVVNHAGKWRYMSGGRVTVPFVLRGAVSNGIGMAAQHSQTLEAWFVHAPGLVVIMPSTPYDAKGLLKAAIRDDNPVVFLEKRLLYARPGQVPTGDYVVPIGIADVKREGSDVTVVTYAQGVHLALQAARQVARDGVEVEVVDLRTLKPFDIETVAASVQKTGRLIAVTEAARAGSMASEIVARVTDEVFDSLKAAPVRVDCGGRADAVRGPARAGRAAPGGRRRRRDQSRRRQGLGLVKTGQLSTRNEGGGLQSVIKSFALVEALVDAGEANAATLAEELGEPRSSVYRMLATLQQIGVVEPGSRRGLHRPGLGLVRLGGLVLTRFDERQLLLPVLESLRAQTKETVHLALRRGNQAVFIERLQGESTHALAIKLGGVLPLHVGASPRALLAFEPDGFWDEYFTETVIEAPTQIGAHDRGRGARVAGRDPAHWRLDLGRGRCSRRRDSGRARLRPPGRDPRRDRVQPPTRSAP